jgi:hypothetical protein
MLPPELCDLWFLNDAITFAAADGGSKIAARCLPGRARAAAQLAGDKTVEATSKARGEFMHLVWSAFLQTLADPCEDRQRLALLDWLQGLLITGIIPVKGAAGSKESHLSNHGQELSDAAAAESFGRDFLTEAMPPGLGIETGAFDPLWWMQVSQTIISRRRDLALAANDALASKTAAPTEEKVRGWHIDEQIVIGLAVASGRFERVQAPVEFAYLFPSALGIKLSIKGL